MTQRPITLPPMPEDDAPFPSGRKGFSADDMNARWREGYEAGLADRYTTPLYTHPAEPLAAAASPDVAKMVERAFSIARGYVGKYGFESERAIIDAAIDAATQLTAVSTDVAGMVAKAKTAAHNLATQHLSTDLGKLINLIDALGAAATQARGGEAKFDDWWYGHDGVRQRQVAYLGWPCTKDLAETIWNDARLATQPAPALAREPLTDEQIVTEFSRPCYQSEDLFDWFDAGVKFAERAHGITADSARAAALEEAAMICEGIPPYQWGQPDGRDCAAAIRARAAASEPPEAKGVES